jgi:uncharacterized protein
MTVQMLLQTMFDNISGFDWDDGNSAKCQKHGVSIEEIEALFSSDSISVLDDDLHSAHEQRFLAIGCNPGGRYIFLGFTLRNRKSQTVIRVITARYMHKKEIDNYAQKNSHFEN